MPETIDILREATTGSKYEGRLYLVGGLLRDRALGLPAQEDVDLVLQGDALELAAFLTHAGITDHAPVLYPRFGTAMVSVNGHAVEMVGARSESYEAASRKPSVRRATLRDDVFRRDFTINTLLENLHSGETLDLTGLAVQDLKDGIIRTPLPPRETFFDDPLRMLRALRFAVRLGFSIHPETWSAVCAEAHRINLMGPDPPVVSAERIRDEFLKVLTPHPAEAALRENRNAASEPGPVRGLRMLRESGLLRQFLPELEALAGVTQNDWHLYDVWDHTLDALSRLPDDAPLALRLGLLFHDVGKPTTRTEDEKGVHFYEHQRVGAGMTSAALHRLRLTNEEIRDAVDLVRLHMRLGEARPEWTDAAVRRLIRDTAPYVDWLFELSRCDHAAMRSDIPVTDLDALRARMDRLNAEMNAARIESPLDGIEIMEVLGISPGPQIREAKEFLINEIIEGRLPPVDKEAASAALKRRAECDRPTSDS